MARALRCGSYVMLAVFLFYVVPVVAQYGAPEGEWRAFGGDNGGTGYAPLDQINRDNVQNLTVAWTWRSDNFGNREFQNRSTPVMANGILYFTAGDRRTVIAADAGTGETLWMWRIDEETRYQQAPRRNSGRGVSYWADGGDERIFVVTPGFQLASLDARTGVPVSSFGNNGLVDLFEELEDKDFAAGLVGAIGNSSPPVVAHGVVVVGPALRVGTNVNRENVKADIMAFDARTGQKRWVFHTVPRRGEPGYETWEEVDYTDPVSGATIRANSADYTGNIGAWAPLAVDEELGYVYLPLEAPTNDFYGGHRPGDNLYSDSLVCLDIRTGEMKWYFQTVHHDIWDWDIPAQPILVDINVEGRPIKAVVQLSKQAFAYVFDRVTGEPVWPIEERAVPQSDVPGERTSLTQPIPTKPPGFDMQGVTIDDLIDFTPALRAAAIEAIEGFRIGPVYTPPSLVDAPAGLRGTLHLPGYNGGANPEGGVSDPETGFVYVGSATLPHVMGARGSGANLNSDFIFASGTVPNVQGLRLFKPPYGRITAYDMNKGEIAWQVANGDTPAAVLNNPALAGVDIPRTGTPTRAGLLVTRTLLFGGEGWGGDPMFRAYDKLTGEILWETELPGMQGGRPMSYMHQGRQYIVLSVGNTATQTPAQFIAFALPPQAGGQRGGQRGQ